MALHKHSYKTLFVNIALMVAIGIILIMAFFMIYMPSATKHGETITVPDFTGLSLEELKELTERRQLRFEIGSDSLYSSEYPPLTVMKQYPAANAKVKENRKIYISLNALNPPMIRMPQLIDGSVKSAQLVLKSYDLLLGEITYVPDIAVNAVIRQFYNGNPIEAGQYIPKGVKIDLEVGDGLGNQDLESPYLIGLTLEDAQFAIIGSGLKVGDIFYALNGKAELEVEKDDGNIEIEEKEIAPGSIFKQRPKYGRNIKLGEAVDLWVVDADTTSVLEDIF